MEKDVREPPEAVLHNYYIFFFAVKGLAGPNFAFVVNLILIRIHQSMLPDMNINMCLVFEFKEK